MKRKTSFTTCIIVAIYALTGELIFATPPAVPSGLAIINPTESQLELTWSAQTDALFFRIERQKVGDVAWEVLEFEYPGEFTHYKDNNVESETSYEYRMVAVNVSGSSGCSTNVPGTTTFSQLPTIFREDFESGTFGLFTSVDVLEPAKEWSIVTWDFGSTLAAQGNNFGGGAGPTEDWLITTNPINFVFYQNEIFQFDAQNSFSGPTPKVFYSTDYDPVIDIDPNTATWILIHDITSSNGTLTPEGPFDLSGIPERAYIGFQYTGDGSNSGQSIRATIDDIIVKGENGYDFSGTEDTDIILDASNPWALVNVNSATAWQYNTVDGQQAAVINNDGSANGGILGGSAADDYLISPLISVFDPLTVIDFQYFEDNADTLIAPLTLLVTNNYTGDPTTTTWTDITPTNLNGATSGSWLTVTSQQLGAANVGNNTRIAFRYQSSGNTNVSAKQIGIDLVSLRIGGPLNVDFSEERDGATVTFSADVTGGVLPYSYLWDFGDGNTSTAANPIHTYISDGTFTVTLTVTDGDSTVLAEVKTDLFTISTFNIPAAIGDIRVAAFNTSMFRNSEGELATDLSTGLDTQIQQVAETIQRANPDIILLNEFDGGYVGAIFDQTISDQMVANFKTNYLEVAQAPDTSPVVYTYHFIAGSNTGIQPEDELSDPTKDFDFNNSGGTDEGNDAFGFGTHAGQYGMVVLSKYPIVTSDVRTFQKFLWKDMPGALLPPDPLDSDSNGDTTSFYTTDELAIFRLSSKSHWDVPIDVNGEILHVLCSHPTPPTFDDGEATVYPSPTLVDWNGLRNHDEIRFWADYITPGSNSYIYDDAEWIAAGNMTPTTTSGGFTGGERFVILGDENADPTDGDATFNPILQLLDSPLIDTTITPSSAGALEQITSGSNRETKTSDFGLRADYALPSIAGWAYLQGWVFWPELADVEADLLGASDHRMVVNDLDFDFLSFSDWKISYGHFAASDLNQGLQDDPEGDQRTNEREWHFITDPNIIDDDFIIPVVVDIPSANGFEVHYSRNRNPDITWSIEISSSDLAQGSFTPAVLNVDYEVLSVTRSTVDHNAEDVVLRFLTAPASGRLFVKIISTTIP